jgi:hypothetical protein
MADREWDDLGPDGPEPDVAEPEDAERADLERRLRDMTGRRASTAGSATPLSEGARHRIRRRRRSTGVSAALALLLVMGIGLVALHGSRSGDDRVATTGGATCYPAGLPTAMADAARHFVTTLGRRVAGATPRAWVAQVPVSGVTGATVPSDADGGFVLEITGMYFYPLVGGFSLPDPHPLPATGDVVMYDRFGVARDIGGRPNPRAMAAIGPVYQVSLNGACYPDRSSTTEAVPPTSAATTTTAVAAPTTVDTSGVAFCRPGQLTVQAGGAGMGLGHWGMSISFRNVSASTCQATGYPRVVAVDDHGAPAVVVPQTPGGYLSGLLGGVTAPPVVVLAPGQTATAGLEDQDAPVPPAQTCPTYPALLVTPPGQTTAVRLDVPVTFCEDEQVHPLIPGSTGQG